jgi:hypothetical protein
MHCTDVVTRLKTFPIAGLGETVPKKCALFLLNTVNLTSQCHTYCLSVDISAFLAATIFVGHQALYYVSGDCWYRMSYNG